MDYSGNILNRIEDAIINTFFWAEELGHRSELFKLDDKNFQGSFKKRIVQRINECLVEDKNKMTKMLRKMIKRKKQRSQ